MNEQQGQAAATKLGKGSAIFVKADVSKWEENLKFFKIAKETFGRIDFGDLRQRHLELMKVAANAGIDDTQDLAGPWDGISKPNLKTIEVDLFGPIYATFLAIQYFRSGGT